MSNISINLNLRQLNHAVITTKKGARCILIPIVENQLIEGEKGIYLNIQAWELKNKQNDRKDTHILKQSLKKEVFEAMSDDEKKEIPIIGNLTVWSYQEPEPKGKVSSEPLDIDELPF